MVCLERWCPKVSDYPVVPGDCLRLHGDTVYVSTESSVEVPIAVLPSPIPDVESVECRAIRIYELKLEIVCGLQI